MKNSDRHFFLCDKQAKIVSVTILLMMAASILHADGSPPQRYLMQSGIVEYSIRGKDRGKAIIYFDKWGMREVKYSSLVMEKFGLVNLMVLFDKNWIYKIDLDKRVANKEEDKTFQSIFDSIGKCETFLTARKLFPIQHKRDDERSEEFSCENPQMTAPGLQVMKFKQDGGRIISQEVFLEKECDVWQIEKKKLMIWVYNGIPLKIIEGTGNDVIVYWGIKLDENVVIEEDKFKIPEKIYFMKEDISTIVISKIVTDTYCPCLSY